MQHRLCMVRALMVVMLVLGPLAAGCRTPCTEKELAAVDYAPAVRPDWEVSSPEREGLDSALVAQLYCRAARLQTTRSVLLIKNGRLIAEAYFHGGAIDTKERLQSVTKSVVSAVAGIAVHEGRVSLDQRMVDFFPELAGDITDERKKAITFRQLLQMRAGYPWEESSKELFDILYTGFRPSMLVSFPLVYEPGAGHEYSNLTAHLAGVIVARATGRLLTAYAQEKLFTPLGVRAGEWTADWEGNTNGHADLFLSARDMARFGQLYLDDGAFDGRQLVPADWVHASLQTYSADAWPYAVGSNFRDIGYGYLWWSARAGDQRFHLAWGHGGQQIVLDEEHDLVIVITADPLVGEHGGGPWEREKENLNLAADFIGTLPAK